jgi:hypothetical protein
MATSIFRDNPTIASRYLADQLTEPERTAYEAALAEDPEILRELEATARLKVGLARLRRTGELPGLLRRSRFFKPQLLVAMAAAVAAVVIGIGLWHSNVGLSTNLLAASRVGLGREVGNVLPVASTHALFTKRAEAYDAVIEIPVARGAIELRVLPQAGAPTEHYRVSLARIRDEAPDQPLATVGGVLPGTDGFLQLYADSAQLAPGRYRLSIAPEGSDEGHESFVIRVTGRPGGQGSP